MFWTSQQKRSPSLVPFNASLQAVPSSMRSQAAPRTIEKMGKDI